MSPGLASSSDNRLEPAEVFSKVLQRKNAFLVTGKKNDRPAAAAADEPFLQNVLTNLILQHSEDEDEGGTDDDDDEGRDDSLEEGEEEGEEDVEEDAPSHEDDSNEDRALANEAKASAPVNSSGYTLRKRLNAARKRVKDKKTAKDNNKTKKTPPAAKAFQLRRIREQQKKAGKKNDDDEAHLRA